MFQRIVVPLDGSERAEQAIPVAATIARATGGSIVFLQVVESPTNFAWSSSMEVALTVPESLDQERAKVRSYLRQLVSSKELQGVETATAVADGGPAQAILMEARRQQADLIVMCCHGRTGFTRWLLGSVSQKVACHSTIPILILRPQDHQTPAFLNEKAAPIRVMVALDGSDLAEAALAPAAALTRALSAQAPGALHLASVVPVYNPEFMEPKPEAHVIQIAQHYLDTIVERLQQEEGQDLSITSSVSPHVDTTNALVELAETGKGLEKIPDFHGCDVIAMATHGRGGLARWVMGSITERVLSATRLPLLIIRPPKVEAKHEAEEEVRTSENTAEQSWVGLL